MAFSIKKAKANEKTFALGVWMEYRDGTELEGEKVTRLKISRAGNKFQAFVQRKLAELKRQKKGADLDEVILDIRMEPVYREAYARFVVLDWEHLLGEDDTPVAFDFSVAMEALKDPDMMSWVQSMSKNVDALREAAQESDGKN